MGPACTYCESDVERHEPVFVSEGTADGQHEAFCNYACLAAYIEAENRTDGAACEWNP